METDDGKTALVRISDETVRLERHIVPRTLEFKTGGDGEPETYARVEVGESGSKLTELRFRSTDPDARGVRQTDLRDVEVKALLEDFVAMFTIEYGLVPVNVQGIDTFALELLGATLDNGLRAIHPASQHRT